MDYLTSGNACLKEGASLIAWGAFFTSLGWVLLGFLLGKYVDINRWKVKPFRNGIIAIILLIGIIVSIKIGLKMSGEGGTLTTKGWNLLNIHSQRQNLISAVAQELTTNILFLESPPIKGETYYKKNNGYVVIRPFPTFKTIALNAVMSSGLLDFGNQTEKNFFDTILDYEIAIGTANNSFDVYNDIVNKVIDPNGKIALSEKQQRYVSEKDFFKSLENKQDEVIKLLLSEYEWAIPSKDREQLELLYKTHKRAYILEAIHTADELVKQGEQVKAKAKLEEVKDSEFLTDLERELIAKWLKKLSDQLDEQKKEITDLYNSSVEFYKSGQLEKSREGFVKVEEKSDLLETPTGETAKDYLVKIDNILAHKAEPLVPAEAQPEDTQPEVTFPKNQVQEVNLKSESPSF
jgi:hypothetical protein